MDLSSFWDGGGVEDEDEDEDEGEGEGEGEGRQSIPSRPYGSLLSCV